MSAVSNFYAAKLYSEHPIAIWPLDDDVSYISLIDDQQRTFEVGASPYVGWTIDNGTADDALPLPDEGSPFDSEIYAGIAGDTPVSNGTIIEAISPELFLFSDCSEELETFCISMYVYQPSVYAVEYNFGYKYYDDDTASWVEVLTTVSALSGNGWINLQDTFYIEEFDADYCHLIFRVTVDTGGSPGEYDFIFNGITVGQWSENFTSVSLGATKEDPPASYDYSNYVVPADQYGLLSDNSYYIVEDGKLLAKNSGIPMVFGSENVTKIYPSSDENASLIIPNKNMFTETGKYKDFTLEFWLKIRPTTRESRRILGPIDTTDGIYVQEGFISLVINNNFFSHNVSEWYRPMIVHLVIKNENFSMFINGEQVGQLSVDIENMNFSQEEWLGIYSYEDINMMEVDCVSIFPYAVPLQVARKRFVWGQGTDPIELINDQFEAEEVVVNFSNSKYAVNKIYPDMERWDAGYYNNLIATTSSISMPEYSLPIVNLGGRDIAEWYTDNNTLNDLLNPEPSEEPKFFTFRPNIEFIGSTDTWVAEDGTNWTEQCYLNFTSLSFLARPLSAFYAIFETVGEVEGTRTLFKIVNTLNGKVFEIIINGYEVTGGFENEVIYEFDGEELTDTGFQAEEGVPFVVGCHIPSLSNAFNFELAAFFGAPELLQMYVGGDGTTTFEGKIYRIGFSDQLNYGEISESFDDYTGIVIYDDEELLEGPYASYTLSPFFRYETFFLDISVSCQWEEYFPLSSFASYITTSSGSTVYDLDYMQINFGYPSLIEIVAESVDNEDWTYQELQEEYNYPISKSYEILDNALLTGYADYTDLASNIVTQYQIDTTGSSLQAYATFQLLAEGANEPLDSFEYSKALTDSYTVYAETENTNEYPYKAYNTKFSIIDGTIVYPPKTINFQDVAIVIHFNIEQDGIISNPLKVKSLEIASRCLNQNSLTEIGTKSGIPMYPYVKTGIYFSGKSKNPIMIEKNNLPYLYLTENSGIRVLEDDAEKEYGIIVPINQFESVNYSLGAIQMFIKYDVTQPVLVTQVIATMSHPEGVIEFTITSDETALRYYIGARDKLTKENYENLTFYQNGIRVVSPYVSENEWNSIAIALIDPIDLSGGSESFNLFYGCNFNNISFFKTSGLNQFGVTIPKVWSNIYEDVSVFDWQYWYDENGVLTVPNEWKDIYVLEETFEFSTTPKEIYQSYCGTNIIVVDDDTGMSIENDEFAVFADQSWLSVVSKPV